MSHCGIHKLQNTEFRIIGLNFENAKADDDVEQNTSLQCSPYENISSNMHCI